MPCSSANNSLQAFNIPGISQLQLRAPKFIPVYWQAPPSNWYKVNTDGSFSSPDHAGFGGVFRDTQGKFLGGFSFNVNVPSAIDAEILAVIEAIRVAWVRRWTHIWLETNSLLVIHYFHYPQTVPWRLRVPWLNCLYLARQLQFFVSHIYRERNSLADRLAHYGASNSGSIWWLSLPDFLYPLYGRDLASMVSYRFHLYFLWEGFGLVPLLCFFFSTFINS